MFVQVIFGRNLRDFLPSPQTRYKPQPQWIMLREDRERALAKRAVSNMEKLDRNCRVLTKLAVGDSVLVQNQVGNYPSRWDITGIVVEVRDNDQYVVRVDGSGRMTLRNRRFLKKITPYSMTKHFKTSDIPVSQSQSPAPEPTPAVPAPEPETRAEPEFRAPPVQPVQPSPEPVVQPTPVTEPSTVPVSEPVVRRSSRVSKEPDRLVVTGEGKSYVQAVSDFGHGSELPQHHRYFHHCDPGGGGGPLQR